MPNALLTPEKTCSALRHDGQHCRAPRMPGRATCVVHDPERSVLARAKTAAARESIVVPDLPLEKLVRLDADSTAALRSICKGLRQHLAARTIDARQASAIMALAEREHALAPKQGTSTSDLIRAVLSEKPQPIEQDS